MLEDRRAAEWLAVAVALLWAASPFLASSSLVVVQRMTGLSAFFALLALNFMPLRGRVPARLLALEPVAGIDCRHRYPAGRAGQGERLSAPGVPVADRMAAGVKRPDHDQAAAQGLFLDCVGRASRGDSGISALHGLSTTGYLYRDFTLTERLLTQPRVLFDYIFNLLIPVTESITPFHDAYRHSTGLLEPITHAVFFAGAAGAAGSRVAGPRSQPLVASGCCGFLPVTCPSPRCCPGALFPAPELFARDRALSCAGCAGHGLAGAPGFGFPMRAMAGGVYFLVFTAVLANGTIVWGNRELAAEMWYINDRDSERAAQYLFSITQGLEKSVWPVP